MQNIATMKKTPTEPTDNFQKDIVKYFSEYGVFKDLMGIKNECMAALYAAAHQMYQNNKYKEAKQMFSLLCTLDHLERKYWLGLGACCQMEKKYTIALECYGFAVILEYKNPDAHLYAAECMLALGKKEEAKPVLRNIIELCTQKDQLPIKEKAKALLSLLK